MLDNICSLPLSADIFAQAIHPTEPLLSVGLSSGHVETFRLPPIENSYDNTAHQQANSNQARADLGGRGRRTSENGFDMVESIWRTRRHRGSCRNLAFSLDGQTLFSTGTDGLIKAAATETGKVTAKVALPQATSSKKSTPDAPSIVCALSPQTLLLGSDSGYVHVYDLRSPAHSPSDRPSQTFRPHVTPKDPAAAESISSLTRLPPTSASTSGASKMWVSTSGSTLAVTDLRKGVVAVSVDQSDGLMSSVCLASSSSTTHNRNLNSRRAGKASTDNVSHGEKILVGCMSGSVAMWDRGNWTDRTSRYKVGEITDPFGDRPEVEQLAAVPEDVVFQGGVSGRNAVAAGLSNGRIAFLEIDPKRTTHIGDVSHDDGSVDGVTTLGFDVAGRMISGGGQLIKIWHEKFTEAREDEEDPPNASTSQGPRAIDNEDDSSEEDCEEEAKPVRKAKRKRSDTKGNHGDHGIMAFDAMD